MIADLLWPNDGHPTAATTVSRMRGHQRLPDGWKINSVRCPIDQVGRPAHGAACAISQRASESAYQRTIRAPTGRSCFGGVENPFAPAQLEKDARRSLRQTLRSDAVASRRPDSRRTRLPLRCVLDPNRVPVLHQQSAQFLSALVLPPLVVFRQLHGVTVSTGRDQCARFSSAQSPGADPP